MREKDRDPIVAICLLAVLSDGGRSPEEQAEFQRIAARLGGGDTSALTMRANQGSLTIRDAVAELDSPESHRTAYEMAAAVVYADGEANTGERAFLAELRGLLVLQEDGVDPVHREVETLALAPLAGPLPDTTAGTPLGETRRPAQAGIPSLSRDAALDELIHKQALLTGALELLPQNLASLAIIPLQMRLVYRIGADYGHTLDPEQIKDLLGAMGVGAAAQVLDGLARRILGGLGRGLFGRTLGGVVGGTAGMATGAGVSFVTTYALGYAAKQYYAQGRRLSREDVQALFQRFRAEAEALLPRVQEEIHQQAQHLDLKRIVDAVRGT
jgi:uncharacterized protein (DUF697 family)/tellurite resistance protein